MKMTCLLFYILTILLSHNALALERIGSGRPGQSFGPNALPVGLIQFQSGVTSFSESGMGTPETNNSNTVIRMGLKDDFELSAVIDYQKQTFKNSNLTQEGFSTLQAGFRYNLRRQSKGLLPAIGLQTRFKLTSISNAYSETYTAPIYGMALAYDLGGAWSFTSNLLIKYSGTGAVPTHAYTASFTYAGWENFETFFEVYGNEQGGTDRQFVDGGLGYYIGQDTKLDFAMGWGENFGQTSTFVSLGISWRMRMFNSDANHN